MEEKKEKWWNNPFIIIAAIAIIIVYGSYIFNFHNHTISKSSGDWGTFGDFIGGTLNPTLAFLSLLAILQTIRIQSKELAKSSEALELSKEELAKSSIALIEQSNSLKIQNFETTFFNMINLHNEMVKNISLIKLSRARMDINGGNYPVYMIHGIPVAVKEDNDFSGKKALSKLFEILNVFIKDNHKKDDSNIIALFNQFYLEHHELINNYFLNIYQILNFINTNNALKSKCKEDQIKNQKTYSDIFRAQLSTYELALLLMYSLYKFNNKDLFPLLVKFEIMENLEMILSYKKTKDDKISEHYVPRIFHEFYLFAVTKECILKTREIESKDYEDDKIFGSNIYMKDFIVRIKSIKDYNL